MEMQEDIRLQGRRRPHDFEQRMAERNTQKATTNTPANSQREDAEEDNDVLGALVDHIMNRTTYASSFARAVYFIFGDQDAPDDEVQPLDRELCKIFL